MRPICLLLLLAACNPSTSTTTDGGPDADQSTCAAPTGSGTMHSGVTQAETWTAAASPHVIPADMNVSAALTIDPCAVVKIAQGKTITVRMGGSITANGTATEPVTFDTNDAGKNWSQIRTLGGTMSFTYTRLQNGGDPLNALIDIGAVLDVRGVVLHADHLSITGSASQGVYMIAGGTFSPTSTALVIQGAKHHPIHAAANVAGTIPDGTYTGNGIDEIDLEGGGMSGVNQDTVFHDRGVPYRVGDPQHEGRIDVATMGGVAKLTIEPNVKLRFIKGGGVYVQVESTMTASTGALVAAGTMDKPIVFTSAETSPAAGDWFGIHFNGIPNPSDKLDYVSVEYAGGNSALVGGSCLYPGNPPPKNTAAIRIFMEPSSAFITNTTIVSSAHHGFDRGWAGASTVSFLGGGNNVQGFAGCKETYPTPTGMPCPTPPPCPM